MKTPPATDRLIVHKFDPVTPAPGGIDTCIRGLVRHAPADYTPTIVGVAGNGDRGRVGSWEEHELNGRLVHFLPVATLDPGQQARRIPHSARVIAGLAQHWRKLPEVARVQAHRMDTALAASRLLRRPLVYFVHTQEGGLTGQTSDSFWRFASAPHAKLEERVTRTAQSVVVFNPEHAELLRTINPNTLSAPTWFEPALAAGADAGPRDPRKIVWFGRLETPKDPALAVDTVRALVESAPDEGWSLDLVGGGTLADSLREKVAELPDDVRAAVTLVGRVKPQEVIRRMHAAGVQLMTSHPGYEGFPRVLVESLSSGLPAVVTEGSDTGSLVRQGETGFVGDRNPATLAGYLRQAQELDRDKVSNSVAHLSAPHVVRDIYEFTSAERATARAKTRKETL